MTGAPIKRIEYYKGHDYEYVMFDCPGCGMGHRLPVNNKSPGISWDFNRDEESPTIHPSILTQYTKMTTRGREDLRIWHLWPYTRGRAFEHTKEVCHSFVTNGSIRFEADSTHALSGQTVLLPEV